MSNLTRSKIERVASIVARVILTIPLAPLVLVIAFVGWPMALGAAIGILADREQEAMWDMVGVCLGFIGMIAWVVLFVIPFANQAAALLGSGR